MHIQKVTIKNFRCFEHLEVNLDPDINIFVGNNGSGKSALLDGIAAAMYPYVAEIYRITYEERNSFSPQLSLEEEDEGCLIISKQDISAKKIGNEQKRQLEFAVYATDFPDWKIIYRNPPIKNEIGKSLQEGTQKLYAELYNVIHNQKVSQISVIAYYKCDRNLIDITDVKNIPDLFFNRFDAFKKAFNATANFKDLSNWFFLREYEELREGKNRKDINFELRDLKQVRNAISTIIAPNARVYFSGTTSAKLMVEWEMETGEKRELLLSQLSAGYRNMLALVMDFARRLAQANPYMENPLAAEAILMIDELDLHLHPTWQQKIIPDLKKVFPNTQIIATTHSPEVVTTVQQNQVKILEDYQIKECPSPTRGMKSSDIVRYVLGLSDLRPDTEESRTLTQLFEAIDNGQLEEAKRLKKELQHWESFDPDMTRADMQIRRLERRNAV